MIMVILVMFKYLVNVSLKPSDLCLVLFDWNQNWPMFRCQIMFEHRLMYM